MKITRVTPYVLEQKLNPDECFAYSQNHYTSRVVLVCRVDTDEGISGWGESFGPSFIHKTTIEKYFAPKVIGRNPFDTEVIWEDLFNLLRDHSRTGLALEAMSAIDTALWDIKGQAFGLPVYRLLGGSFRDHVVPYATGLYQRTDKSIEAVAEEALTHKEAGFRGMKLKIGFGFDYDMAAVDAVRSAIGDDQLLMIDANHGYNARTAIEIGRVMEPYKIEWFEEPVPPEDLEGYKEVKAALNIPISGGETESTRYDFDRWLHPRIVDIIQPDLGVVGGISEFRKIAALAHTSHIQCYPHIWGSAINFQAALHCALNLPDFPHALNPREVLFEHDRTSNVFRDELSLSCPRIENGILKCPDTPGLGLEINEDIIEKYRVG